MKTAEARAGTKSPGVAAHARFALFCGIVLVPPGALMTLGDPQLVDLGKLALILGPAVAGSALNLGLGGTATRVDWRGIPIAAVITLTVALAALAVSLVAGGSTFRGPGLAPAAAAGALGGSALTSVLEEIGWAGGGLALARRSLGHRAGVVVLGLVWAAWHLIPAWVGVGLFPELEVAPAGMVVAFVASCLIYRVLLTGFVDRFGTWLAAAAGHAAPNVVLTGFVASGLILLEGPQAWPLFPAPGGVVFPVVALAAVVVFRRVHPPG